MAVLPVEKIHIVVHKSIKEQFLKELQKAAIVHIAELEETTSRVSNELSRIDDALNQLAGYKKRSPLAMFFNMKRPIPYDTFVETTGSYDFAKTVDRIEKIKQERESILARIRQVEEDIALLGPWKPFKDELRALRAFKQTEAIPVVIPSKETLNAVIETLEDIPHASQHVNTLGTNLYYIFFVKKEQGATLRTRFVEKECQIADLHKHDGVPARLINELEHEFQDKTKRVEELDEQEERVSREIGQLEESSDRLAIEHKKERVAEALPETIRTISIIGWILKRHIKKLDKIIEKFPYAYYERIERDPGERPPVALQNVELSKPYEMLVKLYSMPQPKEYDPTPFLAFFFPIMFGLCITDAIYGVLLILISLYLMRKSQETKVYSRFFWSAGSSRYLPAQWSAAGVVIYSNTSASNRSSG